jgi:hypothetical protein
MSKRIIYRKINFPTGGIMSIFQQMKRYFKRRKMRNSLKMRAYSGKRGVSRFHASPFLPILKVLIAIIIIAGIGAAVYFYGIPYIQTLKEEAEPEPTPTPIPTATPAPETYAKADMSHLETELIIPHWFISNPYYFSGKVIYASSQKEAIAPPSLYNIIIYDIASQNIEALELPERMNTRTNYFEPLMNEYWIVWLETNVKGGGRIWGYDRMKKEAFILREYNYGMPKLQLSGKYCMFMCPTGAKSDKLYLYDLEQKESLALRSYNYSKESFSISAPSICETEMIWIDAIDEKQTTTTLKAYQIKEGLAFEQEPYLISSYVFEPKTNGDVIVFLDTQRSLDGNLMIFDTANKTSAPVKVASGVMNYALGDNYVAYTKDEAVFVYYWADGSTGRLSNPNSRAVLSSATDDVVLWIDITDGMIGENNKSRDVLKMATIPFEK